MKKILYTLCGIVLGAGLMVGGKTLAVDEPLQFRVFNTSNSPMYYRSNIVKFVDPDNGNVCYLSEGFREQSISCVNLK